MTRTVQDDHDGPTLAGLALLTFIGCALAAIAVIGHWAGAW